MNVENDCLDNTYFLQIMKNQMEEVDFTMLDAHDNSHYTWTH